MSWGMYVLLFFFFSNPAISSVTFSDCRVTGSYIFPLPPLSLLVKSIVRLLGAQTEREKDSELCWQPEQSRNAAGERGRQKAENLPTLTVSANDLGARASWRASRRA